MGYYFDLIFDGAEDLVPAGPPTRFVTRANWKTLADQNAGDLYHLVGTHRAVLELGFMSNIDSQLDVVKVGFPGLGHNVFALNPMTVNADLGRDSQDVSDDEKYAFGNRTWTPFVYPITTGGTTAMGPVQTARINNYQPRSATTLEVWQLTLISKDAPEEVRETVTKMQSLTVCMLQDDADAVQSIQHAAIGPRGQAQTMKYGAMLGENRPADWPGPGVVHAGFSRDDTQWNFWLKWFEMMTADEV
jgi:phenylpropionate dioxygenase-like ring-hydroxylating dioxygenase large terminal subunit